MRFVFYSAGQQIRSENEDLEYRHKVSPYVGVHCARIAKTILRGDVIYDIEAGFSLYRQRSIYP